MKGEDRIFFPSPTENPTTARTIGSIIRGTVGITISRIHGMQLLHWRGTGVHTLWRERQGPRVYHQNEKRFFPLNCYLHLRRCLFWRVRVCLLSLPAAAWWICFREDFHRSNCSFCWGQVLLLERSSTQGKKNMKIKIKTRNRKDRRRKLKRILSRRKNSTPFFFPFYTFITHMRSCQGTMLRLLKTREDWSNRQIHLSALTSNVLWMGKWIIGQEKRRKEKRRSVYMYIGKRGGPEFRAVELWLPLRSHLIIP